MTRNNDKPTTIHTDDQRGAMVRHYGEAKASRRSGSLAARRLPASIAIAALGAMAALLAIAPAALGASVQPHSYSSSFNASDAVGAPPFGTGAQGVSKIGIDQTTGEVYVGSGSGVYKFNEQGVSAAFTDPSLELHTFRPGQAGSVLEVDNSVTETQGRFYAWNYVGPNFRAFLPSGAEFTGGAWPLSANTTGNTCAAAVRTDGNLWLGSASGNGTSIREYTSNGQVTGKFFVAQEVCGLATDSANNVITAVTGSNVFGQGGVDKYNPDGAFLFRVDVSGVYEIAVDRSNNDIYVDKGTVVYRYDSEGNFLEKFGEAAGSYTGLVASGGIEVNEHTHKVYVANNAGTGSKVDVFTPGSAIVLPTVHVTKPDVGPTSATLRGTVDPEGVATTQCVFEWGTSESNLSHQEECAQGKVLTGSGAQSVSKELTGLVKGNQYFYALRVENANGKTRTRVFQFRASEPPIIVGESISKVNTDAFEFGVTVNPNGSQTHYRLEYGTEAGVYGQSAPVPDGVLASTSAAETFAHLVFGLTPDTEYHYRVVAENDAGTTFGADHHFSTFPLPPANDPCPNALVRKQTGASQLPECRAYELVSAADQGGYDVDSEMIAGDFSLDAAPTAANRFLYSIRYGALPGVSGSPTTFGHDPYVAQRTDGGWVTEYEGLSANAMPSTEPYGSPLAGYDAPLRTFAFGGENICDPCFADGSSNMPVRLPDGTIVRGIEGSEGPIPAEPAGEVRKHLSADGSHFVFGSEQALEPGANDENGSVTLYSRQLPAGPTEIVSTTPGGATMTGSGIAELDVSADGSRVLFGKLVETDSAGNEYFDLYMHVAGSANSIEVANTLHGVSYVGMSADGDQVYFTTADALSGDLDTSVDLYRAAVGSGSASVSRVSTGIEGTGNTDLCAPSGTPDWNALEGEGKCNVVAFAGGAGVAAGSAAVYFVSPEKLDGTSNGVADEANLYVADPGQAPRFVATIDAGNIAIVHGLEQAGTHSYGDFQVTPDGAYAALTSARPIAGAATHGHTAVYRYSAGDEEVVCVSCGPSLNPDSFLAPHGLNVIEDGRVFFTTSEQLALRDSNEGPDVYEWVEERAQLISSGTAPEGSRLASASADGKDVFFFTRDSLAPQDKNGSPVKVYDAREGGGFLYIAPPFACKASDECHGPGTQAAEPPAINTKKGSGRVPSQAHKRACKRGFVKKHRKCVKRHKHRHHRKHHKPARHHG